MKPISLDSEMDVWEAAGYSSRIEYSRAVMEELGLAATDGFNRVPRGGVEIGGVLFGVREGDGVKIMAHRALECEYAFGPSFTLSDNDRRVLQDLLAAPQTDRDLAEMQPVGWYHAHTRSEILLSEKDLELYQRYFPEIWQIALVLRPNRFEPVRAGFFFREPDGTVHAASSRHEFIIQPEAVKPATRVPDKPVPAETAPTPVNPVVPEPALPEQAPLPLSLSLPLRTLEFRPSPALRAAPDSSRGRWAWMVAALAGVLAGALFWIGASRPSGDVTLHTLDVGGQLRIEWNCTPRVVRQSESGELEIEDGARKVLNALSREQLRAGSITYARTSGNVLVRLMVRGTDRTTLTQMARFLGAPVATAPPVEIASAGRPAPKLPADKTPVPREPEREANRAIEPPLQTPVVSPPPPRRLVLPAVSVPSQAESFVPTPPAIEANAPPPMATLIPRLPAPAPVPVPVKAVDPGPPAGKIIWTGKLVRRDTIQIVANHASKGHVTGGLPGAPVRVHVFPAEMTQDGMRIFTADPKWVSAPEAAGAQNGWNRTVYILNPRQAGDVTIVEAPSQQNAWSRLTLRAERSDHAIIVLRWERIPAASAAGDR